MPTSYPGVATATQPPSAAPEPEGVITASLPADGDPPNASTFVQGYRVAADFIAWLLKPRAKLSAWTQSIMRYRAANLHTRFHIDHLGFPAGRYVDFVEMWRNTISKDGVQILGDLGPPGWQVKATQAAGTSICSTVQPASTYNWRGLQLKCETTGAGYVAVGHPRLCVWNDDTHVVMDIDVNLASVSEAIWDASVGFGGPIVNMPTNINFVRFFYAFNLANWQCQTNNGGVTTSVDSGVAAVANQSTRLRIEWHGANVADNATRAARFYIDGALVATITTNLPPVNDATYGAAPYALVANATGGAPVAGLYVGPMRVRSNIYAADVV